MKWFGEKQDKTLQPKQQQADSTEVDLENRLKRSLENISLRLSQSELARDEYFTLVFEQLKAQGILSGIQSEGENPHHVGHMTALFETKVPIKCLCGLQQTYVSLNSPLSDKAQQDIAAYNNLEIKVGEHIRQKIGAKSVSEEEFQDIIRDYLFSILPDSLGDRRYELSGRLSVIYSMGRTFVPPIERIDGHTYTNIERALEKIKV